MKEKGTLDKKASCDQIFFNLHSDTILRELEALTTSFIIACNLSNITCTDDPVVMIDSHNYRYS